MEGVKRMEKRDCTETPWRKEVRHGERRVEEENEGGRREVLRRGGRGKRKDMKEGGR